MRLIFNDKKKTVGRYDCINLLFPIWRRQRDSEPSLASRKRLSWRKFAWWHSAVILQAKTQICHERALRAQAFSKHYHLSKTEGTPNGVPSVFGGGRGIRTPVGLLPNGFQDRLVMTTSICLRKYDATACIIPARRRRTMPVWCILFTYLFCSPILSHLQSNVKRFFEIEQGFLLKCHLSSTI